MARYSDKDTTGWMHLECREVLGQWTCRLVAVGQDSAAEATEPYVFRVQFSTLDMVGPEWQAAVLLDEVYRRLRQAITDGYE